MLAKVNDVHTLLVCLHSAADSDRVLRSNQVLEIASWVCHVTSRSERFTYLLLIMPEDFGGHRLSGQPLLGISMRRGAAFLCRFAAAEQKHPVGMVANFLFHSQRPSFGLARTTTFRRPYCLHRTPSSELPMFSASHAHAWAHWWYVPFCFCSHFFCWFFGTLVLCHWRSLQPSFPLGWGVLAYFGFIDFGVFFVGVFQLFSVVLHGGCASSAFPGLVVALPLKVVGRGLFFCRPCASVSLLGSQRTFGYVSLFFQFSVQYLHFVVFWLRSVAIV